MLRERCERWVCKWKMCENLFIFTLNGLIFTSDINNLLPSMLWAEVSIWALLIGETQYDRSPCSRANLPYLLPTRHNSEIQEYVQVTLVSRRVFRVFRRMKHTSFLSCKHRNWHKDFFFFSFCVYWSSSQAQILHSGRENNNKNKTQTFLVHF